MTLSESDAKILSKNPPSAALYDFLRAHTAKTEYAWTATLKIHTAAMHYRMSLRTFRARKAKGVVLLDTVPSHRRVVESLERLETTGEYARKKAYWELPSVARRALFEADDECRLFDKANWRPDPDFLIVPDGDVVASLVPNAIRFAKRTGACTRSNTSREWLVEEMARAFRHFAGGKKKPPAKKFYPFLTAIECIYSGVIPEGFGGGIRSNGTYDATFNRIIDLSMSDSRSRPD